MQKQMQEQQRVYNCGVDVSNLASLRDSQVREQAIEALTICRQVLKDHCGPYSNYSAIHDPYNLDHYNEYTRDGISIIAAIDFADPIKNAFKNIVASAGRMVDFRAKDNTTTAMLLVTEVLLRYLEELSKEANLVVGRRDLTPYQLRTCYDRVISNVFGRVEQSRVPMDDLREKYGDNTAAGILAFVQAMSSSGGNVELATCLRDVYTRTPAPCREYTSYTASRIEGGPEFSVVERDYDIALDASAAISLEAFATDAIKSEYVTEVDYLIIAKTEFTANIEPLLSVLESRTDEQNKIAVVAQGYDQDALHAALRSSDQVALFTHNSNYRNANQLYDLALDVAMATAKCDELPSDIADAVEMYDGRIAIVPNVNVEWCGSSLKLRNYAPTSDLVVAGEHPYYTQFIAGKDVGITATQEVKERYVKLYQSIHNNLESIKNGHQDKQELRDHFMTILCNLTGLHIPTLCLGSMANIIIANKAVAQDAIGAVMAALETSPIANGISVVSDEMQSSRDPELADDLQHLASCGVYLHEAVDAVVGTIFDTKVDHDDQVQRNYLLTGNILAPDDTTPMSHTEYYRRVAEDFDTLVKSPEVLSYPVLQPYCGLREMFKRIRELVLNIVCVSDIVVLNSYLIYPDKDTNKE